MKVLAVIGSPHKNGPSATITNEILDGAKEAGHDIKVYNINDMNIKGCQACGYCKANRDDCCINDDLKPYWKDLRECDVLILSSPNYCGNVTGPMITFMNRHYCLMMPDGHRVEKHKKLIGVFSQGWDNPDGYIERYKEYLHDFEVRNMELTDLLVHTRKMPYSKNSEIMKRAYLTGKQL